MAIVVYARSPCWAPIAALLLLPSLLISLAPWSYSSVGCCGFSTTTTTAAINCDVDVHGKGRVLSGPRKRYERMPLGHHLDDFLQPEEFNADDDDDDDEDDDEPATAYGRRSVAWTERYRRLLPYEHARRTAMSLGLRSKEDWDEYLEDGKVYHGPYLPSRPDEMYAADWVSWDEFLGIVRDHDDARRIVQHVLQVRTMSEYRAFVSADAKRAEGLRIPARPDVVYRGRGWVSEQHFFNRT